MFNIEYIKQAIWSLLSNKLRSWLSTLWIVIWVFSVVVLLAVWSGAQKTILASVEGLWSNLLTIAPWWFAQTNIRWWQNQSTNEIMTIKVANALQEIPEVELVSPQYSARKQIIYWTKNIATVVNAVTPSYPIVRSFTVARWKFIDKKDYDALDTVVVLWNTIVNNLFWGENPLWKQIRIEDKPFTVIWVMDKKWIQAFWINPDDMVYIPFSTAEKRIFWNKYLSSIAISIADAEKIPIAKQKIENYLLKIQNIKNPDDANFTIVNQADILKTVWTVTTVFKTFLAAIASISLFVWWIWIMNIMLVSVTERTREIWIRKAIWARRSHILSQFLIESILLSLFWGVFWVALSFMIIWVINYFWFTTIASRSSIFMWVWFSLWIWILFWILPAYKASKLKPIDALRFE